MITQRTPEWFAARCGVPTASGLWRVMAIRKDGSPAAERAGYMVDLLTERLTGEVTDHYRTPDMQRGIEMEAVAAVAYEAETGEILEQGFWVESPLGFGATPDFLVGADGLVEIKCPRTTTVVRQRSFGEEIPPEHYWQMIGQMLAAGRAWCDLVVYDNRFRDPAHRIWIRRLYLSEHAEAAAILVEAMQEFNRELVSRYQEYGK